MSSKQQKVALAVAEEIEKLPDSERGLVLAWSRDAKAIADDHSLTKIEKLKRLQKLKTSKVILVLLTNVGSRLKVNLWDERTWASRFALGGLAAGVAIAGGKAAGIAAMGSAVGVPVYLLTSAGGALLGAIVQELEKKGKGSK